MNRQIKRYDRHGNPEYYPNPETAAKTAACLAILRAAVARAESSARADMKARQEAGQLKPGERLLAAIFGEMK